MKQDNFKDIKKKINNIADEMEAHQKQKTDDISKKYQKLCRHVESIAEVSDQVFSFIMKK